MLNDISDVHLRWQDSCNCLQIKLQTMKIHLDEDLSIDNTAKSDFYTDVLKGLKQNPKKLSSKYFYDKQGDKLFQKIMDMPEYYLTNCELDIFKNKSNEITQNLQLENQPFDIIELGSGDATKSKHLLNFLKKNSFDFNYMPIDISGNILHELQKDLATEMPDLTVISLEGEYFEMLEKVSGISTRKKVVLFLGANIGNMTKKEALQFCAEIRSRLNAGDVLLIGFDLKKNPHIILNAYNDPAGITAAFNLNLLTRINRELDADFNIENFRHYQSYEPDSGACRSFLVSLQTQTVNICDEKILFDENELIDMEVSQKYSIEEIAKMGQSAGFHVVENIYDSKKWFVDSIWHVI